VAHFALSRTVVMALLGTPSANVYDGQLAWFVRVMVMVTKILYFPILSLSLFPRQWFPGHWIFIPIFLNSLLWGTMIGLCIDMCLRKHRFARSSPNEF
jgi:hypothetical protein